MTEEEKKGHTCDEMCEVEKCVHGVCVRDEEHVCKEGVCEHGADMTCEHCGEKGKICEGCESKCEGCTR